VAPGTGSTHCAACNAGSYQDKKGQKKCNLCAKGTYQHDKGSSSCTACRDKNTYTTYHTGATSSDDCHGPLIRYALRSDSVHELTDVKTIDVSKHESEIEFHAVSGDWFIRIPEHHYTDYHIVKQGKKIYLNGVEHKSLHIEPLITNMFCYKDTEGHGQRFSGYQTKDYLGRQCRTQCRNYDGEDIGPHCEVAGHAYLPSPCGIPKCVWDVKCSAGLGVEYRGNVNSLTEAGVKIACQSWNSNYPHHHSDFHPTSKNKEIYGLGKHNYCRNPDPQVTTKGPWCYSNSSWVRWDYCDVPQCTADIPYFEH